MRIRDFLRLGVIVGPLPNNIADGDLIDAIPVMANFNWLLSQVNANVPPLIPGVTAAAAFTPVVKFGGGSTGITYTQQNGVYVKIGSLVFFAIAITLSSKGSSTGNFVLDGLPYTVSSAFGAGLYPVSAAYSANVTFTTGIVGLPTPATTAVNVVNVVSGGNPVILTDTACTNTTAITVAGLYIAA